MKTVYFVRHGESEANAGAPVFQGETSPLTQKGHEQAKFIAKRCAKLSFELLIASPTLRAQETAKYISELTGKPVRTEALFIERVLPAELFGKPRNDPNFDTLFERWERSFFDKDKRAGSGENFDDLKIRAGKALQFLAREPESNILVVTHGFFLRMMLARMIFGERLTTQDFEKVIQTFRPSNTGLTEVQHQPEHGGTRGLPPPEWTVRVWNDRAHLG